MATVKAMRPIDDRPARARFLDFVDQAKAYKELFLAGAAIVGSAFLVLDYFASKREVASLKCELRAEVALTDSRVRISESTTKLASVRQEMAAARKAGRLDEQAKLEMEFEREKAKLNVQTARESDADAELRSGSCRGERPRNTSPGPAHRV